MSRNREPPTLSLAIVTMDRFKSTVETLFQVDLEAFDDVIIVDDSEDDQLKKWCKSQSITYYRGPGENMQAARNMAIEKCDTEIISFVDDDVLLPTDFAERVKNTFRRHPGIVAAGGPPLSSSPSRARDLCYRGRMTVGRFTGTVYDDSYRWVPKEATSVELLKGANMSFQQEPLKAIGGFDEKYGGSSQREDTDVTVRIGRHGRIIYEPSLLCFHKQTGETGFDQNQLEWRFRNHGYFVKKNFGHTAAVLGFIFIFFRICGNPDSLAQLLFRKFVMTQSISIINCLQAYFEGVRQITE